MTHCQRAEIATEKWSLFRHHRGLAAPDLFLDIMLDRRTWEACLIDCMKGLRNIYGTYPKHVARRVKLTYMLSWESFHSIVVEHEPEHKVICGSKPIGEKHEEGETTVE
jgi:hypothetical protein